MPRHPSVYGNLLKERIAEGGGVLAGQHRLVGGKDAIRHQADADQATRALLNAALDGSLNNADSARTRTSASRCRSRSRASTAMLDPRATWADKDEYDRTAEKLVAAVRRQLRPVRSDVDEGVRDAGAIAARSRLNCFRRLGEDAAGKPAPGLLLGWIQMALDGDKRVSSNGDPLMSLYEISL